MKHWTPPKPPPPPEPDPFWQRAVDVIGLATIAALMGFLWWQKFASVLEQIF